MGRLFRVTSFALACLIAGAAVASAQTLASIAGVVKDASGAVLPGVTVEAASPALPGPAGGGDPWMSLEVTNV